MNNGDGNNPSKDGRLTTDDGTPSFIVEIPSYLGMSDRERHAVENTTAPWPVRVAAADAGAVLIAGSAVAGPMTASSHSPTSATEPPAMLDAEEAARLLGISREALYMRVARGQVPGVVRTGKRRIQFHRERLLTGLAKRASR